MADDHSTSDALKQISSTVRLAKEEEELIGDPPEGIAAHPTNPERTEWSAAIVGPEDTPYSGGVFYLQLHCPPEYPLKPPTARLARKSAATFVPRRK